MKPNIREALKRPSRIFTGYLAEEYDGIGQYVKVTLARSSTSVAMKSRVAAGDFGGGRKFPAGTRVPVISIRGALEVLLGNHPCVTIETFTRTTDANTWGTSEILGLPWYGPSDYGDSSSLPIAVYVTGSEGHTNGFQFIWLPIGGLVTSPLEVLMKVRHDTSNGGGRMDHYFEYAPDPDPSSEAGHINIEHVNLEVHHFGFPSLIVMADGQSLTHEWESEIGDLTGGAPFWIRWRLTTTGVHARIWFDGDPEPSFWQTEITGINLTTFMGRINIFGLGDGVANGFGLYDSIEFTEGLKCN